MWAIFIKYLGVGHLAGGTRIARILLSIALKNVFRV